MEAIGYTVWRLVYSTVVTPSVVLKRTLPGGGGSLPFRNLKRGVMLGLPSGQDVARAMKIHSPLTPDEIASGPDGAVARKHGLHLRTPLWYYILAEAAATSSGHLGPVGSTIVAEVLIGLIRGSKDSILRQTHWKPTLGQTPDRFTLPDLFDLGGVL
jgi:hypothetical protein